MRSINLPEWDFSHENEYFYFEIGHSRPVHENFCKFFWFDYPSYSFISWQENEWIIFLNPCKKILLQMLLFLDISKEIL